MTRGHNARAEVICPREEDEQRAVFEWAALSQGRWPELALMYHTPNEGQRAPGQGARMRAGGLRRGVPDICLPVARGGYHGLYIELKRADPRVSRVSGEQRWWVDMLKRQGYEAAVCYGAQAAIEVIRGYLGLGREDNG